MSFMRNKKPAEYTQFSRKKQTCCPSGDSLTPDRHPVPRIPSMILPCSFKRNERLKAPHHSTDERIFHIIQVRPDCVPRRLTSRPARQARKSFHLPWCVRYARRSSGVALFVFVGCPGEKRQLATTPDHRAKPRSSHQEQRVFI